MQPLTKVMQGATCTVKWALGLPETVEKLREDVYKRQVLQTRPLLHLFLTDI